MPRLTYVPSTSYIVCLANYNSPSDQSIVEIADLRATLTKSQQQTVHAQVQLKSAQVRDRPTF